MKSHILTFAKFIIGWPLSLVALFFIGKILLQKAPSVSLLLSLNYLFIFLALISFGLYFLFRVIFWKKLTEEKGIKTGFVQTAYIWSISEIKRYIPGNIWSFVGRTKAYEKYHISTKTFTHLLFLEILFLIVSSLVVSLFSANFIFYGLLPSFPLENFLIPLVILLVCIGTIIFLLSPHTLLHVPLIGKLFPNFSLKVNIQLFFYMSTAFLFFGLGTYFSITALSVLYVPHILSLSGFFVFSYLVGYLSFITPMGLGVREGLMTVGISKYISLIHAATGAILSRIFLIAAELLFLAFIVLWSKLQKTKIVKEIEKVVKKYAYEIFLFISIVFYTTYFTLTSFLRYLNFYTGRFDLGNMDQTVWNTIHGRIFQLTNPDGTNIISRLAFHADFILVLISPFYYIWQDPRMLLLIQSLALGIGALFVYLIGKQMLKQKSLALVFSLMYLLHPAIEHANLYDFHGVVLAVPLFLAAWYFIIKRHYVMATLFLLLAGTTKEEVWLITGLFGIFFIWKKQKFLGTLLSLFSFSLFYYLFFKAIPLAHGGNHFALSYYSDFGSTPGSVIKNIFLSPLKIISIVFEKTRLWYLFELFFPFGFLSLFSPLFLIFAGPDLAVSLLSQNNQLHNIYFQYAAITIPFILLSALYAVAFLQKRIPTLSPFYLGFFLLTTSIMASYWYGPLPGAKNMNHAMYTDQLAYREEVDDFLQTIPRRYSVAATNNVGSHLSHRQKIFTIPLGMEEADVIVFLLNDQYAQPSLEAQKEFVDTLSKDTHYVKVYEYQDFVLFTKKGLPLHPLKKSHTFTPPVLH